MEEPPETNREHKLAGREKSRRHRPSSRAYLHDLTTSRVNRQAEVLEKSQEREQKRAKRTPKG